MEYASDEICPLPPKEWSFDHFGSVNMVVTDSERAQVLVHPCRCQPRIAADVLVGGVEPAICQDGLEKVRRPRPGLVRPADGAVAWDRRRLEVGGHELDVRIDPCRGKDPTRYGVEEGLSQLPIPSPDDQPRVDGLQPCPEEPIRYSGVQGLPHVSLDSIDHVSIEIQTLHGIRHGSSP